MGNSFLGPRDGNIVRVMPAAQGMPFQILINVLETLAFANLDLCWSPRHLVFIGAQMTDL